MEDITHFKIRASKINLWHFCGNGRQCKVTKDYYSLYFNYRLLYHNHFIRTEKQNISGNSFIVCYLRIFLKLHVNLWRIGIHWN
jgi:hypothetical protein